MELSLERSDDGFWRVRVGLFNHKTIDGMSWYDYEFNTERKARKFFEGWKKSQEEQKRKDKRKWMKVER